jgi:hypothetical protein
MSKNSKCKQKSFWSLFDQTKKTNWRWVVLGPCMTHRENRESVCDRATEKGKE